MLTEWSDFYRITKGRPARPLLLQALDHHPHPGKALDLGAGAMNDSRYLLETGWDVTAVDADEDFLNYAGKLSSQRLHPVVARYEDFDFPVAAYDLVCAMYALPFNPPDNFDQVFERIKGSLAPGGIFCGQFFGPRDEWHDNPHMTFHSESDIRTLLTDLEILKMKEDEHDGRTANGTPKHWHLFEVIARRLK